MKSTLEMDDEHFQRLREQVADAAALCADNQLLELADILHDQLRTRRIIRYERPLDGLVITAR